MAVTVVGEEDSTAVVAEDFTEAAEHFMAGEEGFAGVQVTTEEEALGLAADAVMADIVEAATTEAAAVMAGAAEATAGADDIGAEDTVGDGAGD